MRVPTAIALTDDGRIAVVDAVARTVGVYEAEDDESADVLFILGGDDPVAAPVRPVGVAFADGEFFVVDADGRLVKVFDEEGRFVRALGEDIAHPIENPGGIAVVDGEVLITDTRSGHVAVLGASEGEEVQEFPDTYAVPRAITPAGDLFVLTDVLGGAVYLTDVQGVRTHVIDRKTVPGEAPWLPEGAAWTPVKSRVYVTDNLSGYVQVSMFASEHHCYTCVACGSLGGSCAFVLVARPQSWSAGGALLRHGDHAGGSMTRGWASYQRAVLVFVVVLLWLLAAATILTSPASALAPHSPYASSTNSCAVCHDVHGSTVQRKLLGPDGGAVLTETDLCFTCHGSAGGSDWNVQTGPNSFGLATGSGHGVQLQTTDPATDLASYCSSCHDPHGDPGSEFDLPKKEIDVAGVPVSPANRIEWCTACHNTTHAWHVSTGGTAADYEAKIGSPTRPVEAGYYPTVGTFPGSDHYVATSGHFAGLTTGTVESLVSSDVPAQTVTRAQGDCLWCHASHRSAEPYDAILNDYRPSTSADNGSDGSAGSYAQACFECHGNSSGTVYLPNTIYTNTYWATTVGAPNHLQRS